MKKIVLFLLFSLVLFAELNLPNLSGRIVDEIGLLSDDAKFKIEQISQNLEQNQTTQLVVAIVKSLDKQTIENYSLALARKWGLGVKGKDNGVLLLIAPNEKELRIEVGYGLESVLTDALSNRIINREIVPYFKTKEYENGVINGVEKIALALSKAEFKIDEDDGISDDATPFVVAIFTFFGLTFISNFIKSENFRHISIAGLLSSFASIFIYVFLETIVGEYAFMVGVAGFLVCFLFLYAFIKKQKQSGGRGGLKFNNLNSNKNFGGSANVGFGKGKSKGFGGRGGGFGGGGSSGRW